MVVHPATPEAWNLVKGNDEVLLINLAPARSSSVLRQTHRCHFFIVHPLGKINHM